MFGIGSTELLVILVVALIVLGPKTLTSLSKTLGKAVGEFRRVSTDFQRTLNAEAAQEEYEERKQAEKSAAAATPNSSAAPTTGETAKTSTATPTTENAKTTVTPPSGSPVAQAVSQAAREAEARPTEPSRGAQA